MTNIRDSILQDIHSGKIKPRSRGYYIFLHTFLWGACSITLIFGILSVALIFFELNSPEYISLQWMVDRDLLWLRALPIFWSLGAIISLVLGYLLFSRTDRGYRISTALILTLLCGGSLIGGVVLYFSGLVHIGDQQIRKIEPRYDHFRSRFQQTLPHPEEGQLLLRIQERSGDIWTGRSLDGRSWKVILKCSSSECEKRSMQVKFKGPPTLFIGSVTDSYIFTASDVRLPPRTPAERKKFRDEFGRRNISNKTP